MAGKISKIVYDENVFPVSPFAESCDTLEYDDRVLLLVGGLSEVFTRYAALIDEHHMPTYEGVDDDVSLTMAVTMRGLEKDPMMMFHILDADKGELLSTKSMKVGSYLARMNDEIPTIMAPDISEAMKDAWYQQAKMDTPVHGFASKAERDHFAHDWKKAFFENVFDGRLKGDDAFWNGLYTQMDTALVAVRSQMMNARQEAGKQIIHMYDHANYRLPAPDAA